MIINTGMRTDIPAYYSEWFFNRIHEGFVMVRNPYYQEQVTRYRLTPDVVDLIEFCTKNPAPMLPRMNELSGHGMFWFVTITPYGIDVEPNVPPKEEVMESFKKLSDIVGVNSISWRYDPIFINEKYTIEYHIKTFEQMAASLAGSTGQVVISFIDLYSKTLKNFPSAKEVTSDERLIIGKEFARIGQKYGIRVRSCFEGNDLAPFGVDASGCITKSILEKSLGTRLSIPKETNPRQNGRFTCSCVLGRDIGMYNTCGHMCRYCYANQDAKTVKRNMAAHIPTSPFLIGSSRPGDIVRDAVQEPYATGQLFLDI